MNLISHAMTIRLCLMGKKEATRRFPVIFRKMMLESLKKSASSEGPIHKKLRKINRRYKILRRLSLIRRETITDADRKFISGLDKKKGFKQFFVGYLWTGENWIDRMNRKARQRMGSLDDIEVRYSSDRYINTFSYWRSVSKDVRILERDIPRIEKERNQAKKDLGERVDYLVGINYMI